MFSMKNYAALPVVENCNCGKQWHSFKCINGKWEVMTTKVDRADGTTVDFKCATTSIPPPNKDDDE